jgi:phosphate transport system permease protein
VTPTSDTSVASSDPAPLSRELARGGRGGRGDQVFRGLALAAGLLVLLILGLIVWSMIDQGRDAIRVSGITFVTGDVWDPANNKYGALAFIYGTLLSSLIALILAVPVSVGIALFTTESVPRRLRRPVVSVIDLLAAVPSVVYGLWGILVFATAVQGFYQNIANTIGTWPGFSWIFGGTASGASFMTAGIILALMMTPIVTSISREVISTVPSAQREAAYGMGATRWEVIRHAVLPWSRGGIVGAVILGLGRALGETIAVALTIGAAVQITSHVFLPGYSIAAVIALQFGESSGTQRSALIAMGLLLFAITILVNIGARSIVTRFDRRAQGV